MDCIVSFLFDNADEKYADFGKKLIPDTKYKIIGVRTPILKDKAKILSKNPINYNALFQEKHIYHEQFLLHGLTIGQLKTDINTILCLLDKFIVNIDNWAVCDSTVSALKILKKHPQETLNKVKEWISSPLPYVIRFGVVVLTTYFLDDLFTENILLLVRNISNSNYYVKMGISWFFSIALIKQYDITVKYFENRELEYFVHNKAIQKAKESFRIEKSKKEYLTTLKYKLYGESL